MVKEVWKLLKDKRIVAPSLSIIEHLLWIELEKSENKKYSYLALFLYFKRKEFVYMVIEVTSTYTHTILKKSRKKGY